MADYTFRPLERADYPMVRRWLAEPHIGGWWGDGETELRLIDADMATAPVPTDMRIVEYRGQPFAYVQDYDAHHFDMPQYKDLPPKTRAMDTFLGDPAFLGQGHASGYLAQRISELRRHYPMVAVDPDPANLRAIRTYSRAGLRHRWTTTGEDGDPVNVMTHP